MANLALVAENGPAEGHVSKQLADLQAYLALVEGRAAQHCHPTEPVEEASVISGRRCLAVVVPTNAEVALEAAKMYEQVDETMLNHPLDTALQVCAVAQEPMEVAPHHASLLVEAMFHGVQAEVHAN